MKVAHFRLFVLSLVLSMAVPTVYGQYSSNGFSPYWELHLNGGLSTFYGGLKQGSLLPSSKAPSEWKLGGSLMFGRQHSPVFGFRFQILTGELLGAKQELDRYFENDYYEANINATVNLNNLFGEYDADRKLNFYVLGGVGLVNYNTTLREISSGDAIAYRGFGFGKGIGGRTLEGVLMAGVGADYKINDQFSITFETASRAVNSDMVDLYLDSKKYDFYNYTSLGIVYKFGKSKKKSRTLTEPVGEKPLIEQEVPKQEEVVEEPIIEPEPEIIVEAVEEEKAVVEKSVVVEQTQIPEPEYRVQIRACLQRRISIETLSNIYNIPFEEIKESTHNGYYIYTIGSFATYNEARSFRDEVRSRNRVYDAFVVAFSKGTRLSKLPQ